MTILERTLCQSCGEFLTPSLCPLSVSDGALLFLRCVFSEHEGLVEWRGSHGLQEQLG